MVERARWLVMLPRTSAVGTPALRAQRRDDRVVDVVLGDRLSADGEQQVDLLAGLAVEHGGWVGRTRLPGLDGLAEERVDGFGERGAGLVHGHVEQADRVVGEHVAGVAGDRACRRAASGCSRPAAGTISSLRRPLNSQVRVTARISSIG